MIADEQPIAGFYAMQRYTFLIAIFQQRYGHRKIRSIIAIESKALVGLVLIPFPY